MLLSKVGDNATAVSVSGGPSTRSFISKASRSMRSQGFGGTYGPVLDGTTTTGPAVLDGMGTTGPAVLDGTGLALM
jgi:hypothetical protein